MKFRVLAVAGLSLLLCAPLFAKDERPLGTPPEGVDSIDYQIIADFFRWEYNPELRERRRQQIQKRELWDQSGRLFLTYRFPGAHPDSPRRPYTNRAGEFATAHSALVANDGTYRKRDARRYRRALNHANRKTKKELRKGGELDPAADVFPTIGTVLVALEPHLVRHMGRKSPMAILLRVVGERDYDIPVVVQPGYIAAAQYPFVARVHGYGAKRPYLPFAYTSSGSLLLCGNETFKEAHSRLMGYVAGVRGDPRYQEVFARTVAEYEGEIRPGRTKNPVKLAEFTNGLHDRLDEAGVGEQLKAEVLRRPQEIQRTLDDLP